MPDIRLVSVDTLKPNPQNARTHSKKQIRQIADSIVAYGFTVPLLIDGDGMIIAGHGRLQAAKLLSLRDVPTITLEGLSEALSEQNSKYLERPSNRSDRPGKMQENQ